MKTVMRAGLNYNPLVLSRRARFGVHPKDQSYYGHNENDIEDHEDASYQPPS